MLRLWLRGGPPSQLAGAIFCKSRLEQENVQALLTLLKLFHEPIESRHESPKEKILRYLLRSDLAVHEPLGRSPERFLHTPQEGPDDRQALGASSCCRDLLPCFFSPSLFSVRNAKVLWLGTWLAHCAVLVDTQMNVKKQCTNFMLAHEV